MSTLIERLTEVMAHKGWATPQQVADVAGVSRSAAAQWLGQGSKIIHTIGNMEAAERLERATGYAALWIAKGIGPKIVSEDSTEQPLWPFDGIDEGKIRNLKGPLASKLEGAILLAAAQLNLDIKK